MKFPANNSFEEVYEYYFSPQHPIFHIMSGITNPDPAYEIRRKSANCFSIEYIISGESAIQENDKISKVTAGDVYIMHPNRYHHYFASPNNPYKKIWIVFDCDYNFFENLIKAYKIEDILVLHNTNLYNEFKVIFDLLRNEPANLPHLVESAMFNLIQKMQTCKEYPLYNNLNNAAVLGKELIDRMMNQHINIEKVCDMINISRAQFYRLFKATFNITPAEYILQAKIDAAKTLLAHSEQTISEVAIRFDFANPAHFSRTFHKYVGCSPSEYRAQNHIDGIFSKK